jgi:hypothetical protein
VNPGLKTMPGDMKWAHDFVAQEIAKNKRIIESTESSGSRGLHIRSAFESEAELLSSI